MKNCIEIVVDDGCCSDEKFKYIESFNYVCYLNLFEFIDSTEDDILLIEFPECGIHPTHIRQKIIQIIENINKIKTLNKKIIIETYSNVVIGTFGDAIIEEQISKDDVSIKIFTKGGINQVAKFDKDGDFCVNRYDC